MENEPYLDEEERRMQQRHNGDDAGGNNNTNNNEKMFADAEEEEDVDVHDMLKYTSVKQVTNMLSASSRVLPDAFATMGMYTEQGMKNAITPDDPEHQFLKHCSGLVLKIEAAKTRAFKFLRDHYAIRFPELAMLVQDSITYAKVVRVISNDMNLTGVVDELDEISNTLHTISSHTLAAVIACASTTKGRELDKQELTAVMEASDEVGNLESAKQVMLEYIQTRMPHVAPNLCAFLGTGITSQMFALVGSVEGLAKMDASDMAKLGAKRANTSGIDITTLGFLANSPLVSAHSPELRPKALRYVSAKVVSLARIDSNRRASDDSEGRRARADVRNNMIKWTDPLIKRGRANNIYERRTRKRAETEKDMEREKKILAKSFRRGGAGGSGGGGGGGGGGKY